MVNKTKQDKFRFFYPPEFEKMLDYLNKNGKLTALFMINTGARICECRGFKQDPIFDNERKNITLIHTKVRARLKEKTRFWFILVLNTMGVLPIIYLIIKRRRNT